MERPVQVVARIRDDQVSNGSCVEALQSGKSVRVLGPESSGSKCREFELDGVCSDGDMAVFYGKYFKERVAEVRIGGKATVLMYGPTGTGKTYTMFGCGTEKGVIYNALEQIMQADGYETEVRTTVVEVYNEEVYDLLSADKSSRKAKLDIRGGKVQSARTITSSSASFLSNQIEMVEKTRAIRSTNCNERSSRSHCVVILDVLSVGGCLMLVDMAGSENVERAGLSAADHFQSGKINQGNGALKRVIDAIANNDSYIPYRDSKLTMLLQDSFKVSKSRILMVLCVNPTPQDMHKTISTLEYGAKAKSIIRVTAAKPTEAAQPTHERIIQYLKDEVMELKGELLELHQRLVLKENTSCVLEAENAELRNEILELQQRSAVQGCSEESNSGEIQVTDEPESSELASEVGESPMLSTELNTGVPLTDTESTTETDVLVKWESGEFVSIIRIGKYLSLAELRQSITPNVPYHKRRFSLLMLGDKGCPLEEAEEANYRVISLPSCEDNVAGILAVLRPPILRSFSQRPPLRSENNNSVPKKPAAKKSVKLGREKVSLKERASRAYADELLAKLSS